MFVKYVGPHDAVLVADLGFVEVKRGATVEVDDELGARLLEQAGNWEAAKSPAGPKRDAGGG